MAKLNSDVLNNLEAFITKMEKLFPEGKRSKQIDTLLRAAKESYAELEGDIHKLKQEFEKEANGNEKEDKYPSEIRRHHNIISGIIGGLLTAGGLFGLSYLLGGSNIDAWSRFLVLMNASIGAFVGAAIAIPIKVLNKLKFDLNHPRGLVEKRILKRLNKRKMSATALNSEIDLYIDDIIQGKYNFKERITINKKRFNLKGQSRLITREVTQFKQKFKKLSKPAQRRLGRVISKINGNFNDFTQAGSASLNYGILSLCSDYDDKSKVITNDTVPLILEQIKNLETILTSPSATQKQIKECVEVITKLCNGLKTEMSELSDISSAIKTIIPLGDSLSQNIVDSDSLNLVNKSTAKAKQITTQADADIVKKCAAVISSANAVITKANDTINALKESRKAKRKPKEVVESSKENTNTNVKSIVLTLDPKAR